MSCRQRDEQHDNDKAEKKRKLDPSDEQEGDIQNESDKGEDLLQVCNEIKSICDNVSDMINSAKFDNDEHKKFVADSMKEAIEKLEKRFCVAVAGQSGCGKSLLMEALTGIGLPVDADGESCTGIRTVLRYNPTKMFEASVLYKEPGQCIDIVIEKTKIFERNGLLSFFHPENEGEEEHEHEGGQELGSFELSGDLLQIYTWLEGLFGKDKMEVLAQQPMSDVVELVKSWLNENNHAILKKNKGKDKMISCYQTTEEKAEFDDFLFSKITMDDPLIEEVEVLVPAEMLQYDADLIDTPGKFFALAFDTWFPIIGESHNGLLSFVAQREQ